jgi:hypothetical protein
MPSKHHRWHALPEGLYINPSFFERHWGDLEHRPQADHSCSAKAKVALPFYATGSRRTDNPKHFGYQIHEDPRNGQWVTCSYFRNRVRIGLSGKRVWQFKGGRVVFLAGWRWSLHNTLTIIMGSGFTWKTWISATAQRWISSIEVRRHSRSFLKV